MKRICLWCVVLSALVTGCGLGGGSVLLGDSYYDDGYYGPELIAFDDQYSTFQNQSLSVGAGSGVLANDILCGCDIEVRYPSQTASGGTLVGNQDGSFVYAPPRNFTGTDFFDYKLKDDYGESVGEVIISVNVAPATGFFVDASAGNDGTGSGQTGAPFATIQAAVTSAGTNQTIVVRDVSGTIYAGNVTMLQGQTLVGDDFQNGSTSGTRPRLSGSVSMADGCTLRGLRLEGAAVDGALRVDGEVSLCEVVAAPGTAIDLDGAEGSWLVRNNLLENGTNGIAATLVGLEKLTLRVDSNTIRSNSGRGILLTTADSSQLTAGVFSNILQNNLAGFSFEAQAKDTSNFCLDLSGNQNNDSYRLTRNGALFQVEQVGQLGNLNTGTVVVSADALLDVADGFCGF